MSGTDVGFPDLSDLDLIEDDDAALPADETDDALAEAGMSESGPDEAADPADIETVTDESGVAS